MKPIEIPEFIDKYKIYEREGGVIDFRIFQLDTEQNDTPYQKHLAVAQQTLVSVADEVNTHLDRLAAKQKINRKELFTMDYDFRALKDSGKEISVADFMGWQYEEVSGRVKILNYNLVNPKTNGYDLYFYYNEKEVIENALIIAQEDKGEIGFVYAFLDPPHSFMSGKTIFEKGKFFLDICELLFTDISEIEVYQWSIDSSNYFDEGKEWWGSFFWTVYNPYQDWYIGIMASTTD
ncbi:MAG: hypothetical protein Q3983_02290 [Capnocytophaga sp.]|nr:hypothetical protein [Capnocytophaga sp.]